MEWLLFLAWTDVWGWNYFIVYKMVFLFAVALKNATKNVSDSGRHNPKNESPDPDGEDNKIGVISGALGLH